MTLSQHERAMVAEAIAPIEYFDGRPYDPDADGYVLWCVDIWRRTLPVPAKP